MCSSMFALTLQAVPELDNKNVVIGRVLSGMEVLTKIGAVDNSNGIPSEMVTITSCRRVSRGGRIPTSTMNQISDERREYLETIKTSKEEKQRVVFDEDDDLLKQLKTKVKQKRKDIEVGIEAENDDDDIYEKRKRAKNITSKTRRKFF